MAMRRIFWGFCRNWVLIDPLHYLSSRLSDLPIFLLNIQKPTPRLGESVSHRLPHSSSRRVNDSPTRRVRECTTPRLAESESRRLPDSPSRGVVFRLRISPWIRSQKRNGSKVSVRDLWGPNICKNPRKSVSLPCPFKKEVQANRAKQERGNISLRTVLHMQFWRIKGSG
jgi:hypothetical protein